MDQLAQHQHQAPYARPDESTQNIICRDAAEAIRQVHDLGHNVVNHVEARVHEMEEQDLHGRVGALEALHLEKRIDTLYQRLRPYEDYRTLADQQVAKLRQTEQALVLKRDELELPVKVDLQRHEEELKELSRRVDEVQERVRVVGHEMANAEKDAAADALMARVTDLESQSSSSSSDTSTLALDLLGRLQNGDHVHPALARQITVALSSRRQSDSSDQGGIAPPRSTSKHNGRILNRRGRPLKHGKYARKASTGERAELIAVDEAERKKTGEPSGFTYLSRTPSADLSSAKHTESRSASRSKASSHKMEVPETQEQEKDVDVEMDDQGATSEEDDPPFIPGERKSARKPKPRKFADQVSWAEANELVRGMY